MRKCRKMISVIMLMVMLVSLLPTGAMAAEAPTGATNEVAAVEEPQGNTDEAKNEDTTNSEADKTEDTSTDTSDSGAKENDGTNDVVPTDGTAVETTDEDPAEGTNTEDAELGNTSTEDAGLGNTSTEIAAEVEPVDQTVKKDEKAAGGGDLFDYIKKIKDEVGENAASLTINMQDKNGDNVSQEKLPSGEMGYNLHIDSSPYKMQLKFYSHPGFPAETFTYELPKGINFETTSDYIRYEKDGETITIGTVSIDKSTNIVTAVFNEKANETQDVEAWMYFVIKIKPGDDKDDEIGDVPIHVETGERTKPKLEKVTNGKNGNTLYWKITLTNSTKSTSCGSELTDTISSSNHKYKDADMNAGIKVEATNGSETCSWTIKANETTSWTATKWTYKIPFSHVDSASGKEVSFGDGTDWDFTFRFQSTITERDPDKNCYYYNDADETSGNGHVRTYRNVPAGTGYKKKYASFSSDGSYLYYELEIGVLDWEASDRLTIWDALYGASPGTSFNKTNTPDWEDITVSLIRTDDKYIPLEGEELQEVPMNAYGTTDIQSNSNGFYALLTNDVQNTPYRYSSIAEWVSLVVRNSKRSDNGLGIEGSAVIKIRYKQKMTPEFVARLNSGGASIIRNRLWVNKNANTMGSYYDADLQWKPGEKVILVKPSEDNGYVVKFQISYTPADIEDLDKYKSLTLEDQMSSTLSLLEDPTIVATTLAGETVDAKCESSYDAAAHLLKIKINEPKVQLYTITYECKCSTNIADANDQKQIEYWNNLKANINGQYKDIDETEGLLSEFVPNVEHYGITVNKVDENNKPLGGAKIGWFTENGTNARIEKVTSNDGTVSFTTNYKEGIVFDQNVPYYLKETEAPKGYTCSDTKYWFVIHSTAHQERNEAHSVEYWRNYFKNKGAKDSEIVIIDETAHVETGSFVIPNTPDSIEIPVQKVWNDKKTQHDSVTVKLYADDKDTGKTLVLNEKNNFKGNFTDLAKTDASGKTIVYTVKEVTVKGYNSAITGSAAEGFKITNTPITNIAVEKIWDDANDQDRKRPTSITVHLTKNGADLYTATLKASDNWKGHTWSNLPAYDEDGNEITYSVTEDKITGYAAGQPVKKSETTDDSGVTTVTYTITNTYSPDTVNAKVKKIWADDDNADGLRTSIEVQLTKNGTPMTGDAYKQTLNKANNWEYEWTGLPANEAGVPITYSIMEITQVNGYTTSKPAAVYDEATKTWNISVTNTHDRILIEIPVEKVWRDDKTQHGSITVKLLKGGDDTGKTLELNEANGFKGKFTGLPKFENEGKEIEYTIEEVEVTGYTTAITGSAAEGYTITNTILTNIAVEKVWDDANDQDRKRPASITVYLTKNGIDMGDDYKATLTAKDDWKGYTWSNLPAYDEDGNEITYSVREDPVAEYTADEPVKKSETTDEKTGVKTVTYSIKNSYTPGTVHAKVVKNWDDNNDQDGLRTSIEVELTKNGTGMGDAYKQTLNEANNWTYEWSGLPENTDGVQNTYSIVEISTVTGYEQTTKPETSYDEKTKTWNISVTNKHTPIPTEATVTKVWDDGNNIEGLQPKEIKVQLLDATGDKEIPVRDEVTLNAENEWTYTWTGLDKFKDKGTEIKYTVREVSVPEGYTDEVKVVKDTEGKFKITVTNKHGGRPVSISKTDITNGKEVEGATLQILLNNEVVTAKDEKGKDARAEWTSTKEPHKVYGLTPGVTYTLRETIQPEGFTIIEADTTFSVDENGKVTATGSKVKDNIILVEDAPTFVKVKKVDATSQEEVEGAHIQILDGDKVFDQWDSKKGVVHEVKYLVADRKYTLRETVAPLGYTVISDTEFTVNNKNEVTYKGETVSETIDGVPVILVEDTMTIVKISKTDITGDKELKGATLQILDETGKVVTVKDRKGKDVKCEWVSTDEPHVVEGLEINKTYTLRETISPDGYTIATDATFSIDEKNRVTYSGKKNASGVLLVQDEPTKLYVSKQAVTGDEELPGATLQILDEKENVVVLKDNDGNPVETLEWKSGEEPKYIEGLPTGVNYILRETISPDGYTIASDTKLTIDENGVVTSDGTTSTAEDGTTVLVVKDDFTTVQISKVDTESGAELEGAKLQIIDEDNNIVEEWTSTKEVHVVRGLVANKKYILREQVAPLGYTLTTDTTFSIDMNNVVTSTGPVNKDGVILVNDTMTEVEILKVDSKTGKGLAGAKLQVLDDNGAVCDEWKSTKDAHKIRGLYTGVKYTLHEVEAPKGYDKAKDITFTIDTAGKVSSDALDNGKIVMKDTPTPKKNKTGDEANGSLWALLLMMASGALGGTVWFKRRRRA